MRVTAQNLVHAIDQLPKDIEYQYIHPRNKGRIRIHRVQLPEGPIEFKRYSPTKGETVATARIESISPQMMWRLANSFIEDKPVNIDRVFGGSYNTRSVLEAILVHTPHFYSCKPGRIEVRNTNRTVKEGHKHLIYLPENPHENGVASHIDVNMQISEIPAVDIVYKDLTLPTITPEPGISIEQKRRHAQIQIAIVLIGQQLGFKTWVAANDRGIEYAGKKISELPTVVDNLASERQLSSHPESALAARLIDCIWFKNGRLMPAVMEIEHSTGVVSGLTRMMGFHDLAPPLQDIRWTIVAPDEDRLKVIEHAKKKQFHPLKTKFFPYSAVEELYSLCERRSLKGVTDSFLDCFMEDCL